MKKRNDFDSSNIILLCTGISFIVSLVFTWKLFLSAEKDMFEKILISGLVLTFEIGKIVMVHRAITKKKLADIILAVVLVLISNSASLAFLIDKSNKALEDSKKNSLMYQAGMNLIEANNNYIENSDKKKYRTAIKKSSAEAFEIAEKMQNMEATTAKGYNALFVSIHKLINKNRPEKNKIPLDLIILLFNGLISFTAEMLGVRFAFIFLEADNQKVKVKNIKKEEVKTEVKEKTEVPQSVEIKEEVKKVKEKVKKGIYEENTLYTKKQMQNYINKMFETATGDNKDISKGYQFLSKIAGISATQADNIRVKLIEKGILAKEANRTVIKKKLEEVVI